MQYLIEIELAFVDDCRCDREGQETLTADAAGRLRALVEGALPGGLRLAHGWGQALPPVEAVFDALTDVARADRWDLDFTDPIRHSFDVLLSAVDEAGRAALPARIAELVNAMSNSSGRPAERQTFVLDQLIQSGFTRLVSAPFSPDTLLSLWSGPVPSSGEVEFSTRVFAMVPIGKATKCLDAIPIAIAALHRYSEGWLALQTQIGELYGIVSDGGTPLLDDGWAPIFERLRQSHFTALMISTPDAIHVPSPEEVFTTRVTSMIPEGGAAKCRLGIARRG